MICNPAEATSRRCSDIRLLGLMSAQSSGHHISLSLYVYLCKSSITSKKEASSESRIFPQSCSKTLKEVQERLLLRREKYWSVVCFHLKDNSQVNHKLPGQSEAVFVPGMSANSNQYRCIALNPKSPQHSQQ